MDVVTDLTSQCVSFITVAQEVYKQQLPSGGDEYAPFAKIMEEIREHTFKTDSFTDNFKARVSELIWESKPHPGMKARIESELGDGAQQEAEMRKSAAHDLVVFLNTCKKIFEWLDNSQAHNEIAICNLYSSSYEWRAYVRAYLYCVQPQRVVLAGLLEYMPIQVILCLGAKDMPAGQQRRLQLWTSDKEKKWILNQVSVLDGEAICKWWDEEIEIPLVPAEGKMSPDEVKKTTRLAWSVILLTNDSLLLRILLQTGNPVPFETLFSDELAEVEESRKVRKEVAAPDDWTLGAAGNRAVNDPIRRASSMNLYGLAFSGGGIRSATFNLGVLQKLAGLGILSRFDYLSTVSGGGYIGSWYASWIKRSGSIHKVSDRLNPRKSADPLADEVRPVRWLRMFSNYLAPNASIMSDDSWTMGTTWLRNTMINQVLLLMLLCSTLSLLGGCYGLWGWSLGRWSLRGGFEMWVLCTFLLLTGAFLAGAGMHAFAQEHPPTNLNLEKKHYFYGIVKVWGIISSFITGTWLFNHSGGHVLFEEKLSIMFWPSCSSLAAFLLVAAIGAYHKSAQAHLSKGLVWSLILLSSVVAAVAGGVLMALTWQLLELIYCIQCPFPFFNEKLAFIVAMPLVLEVISVTVVVRMSIMGVLFPDLRREWWGRIGALTHRFILLWILINFCTLMLPDYFHLLRMPRRLNFTAVFGSWSALIGYAVKLAYGPGSSAGDAQKSSFSVKEWFVRFAPYLFGIGLILFGSIVLNHLYSVFNLDLNEYGALWAHLLIGSCLALLTLFLSWRTGVNEFSLHHFYRNRLTRAYLGATRRREARERTANTFTGFDQEDDLDLAELTTEKKYYGPYPLINTTLNATILTDLDRQDRKGESFLFSPKYCGFDVSRTRPSANSETNIYEYAFRPTVGFAYPNGPTLGTAMTISGAAVNPNMGYHSSAATAFLLTVFNVRLGWWIGNPRTSKWRSADPWAGIIYLIKDLAGRSDITSEYVCLSDGGHFDNMGLYELVRRRCRYILLCDAEEDEKTTCEGLANAMRRCRIDFGVEISIDTKKITKKNSETGFCKAHLAKGEIWYPGDLKPSGTLIYVKTSLTSKESVDIREYFLANPAFPQQSTGDQFFDESQFESYRQLGYQSIGGLNEL